MEDVSRSSGSGAGAEGEVSGEGEAEEGKREDQVCVVDGFLWSTGHLSALVLGVEAASDAWSTGHFSWPDI